MPRNVSKMYRYHTLYNGYYADYPYKPRPPAIKKEPPPAMTSELQRRKVDAVTSGAITVHQRNLTLQDLRDFVDLADTHGVEPDAVVRVKQEEVYDKSTGGGGGYVSETKMAVEAPVVFALGSTQPPPVHPRKVARDKIIKKSAIGVGIGVMATVPALFLLGIFLHLLHVAIGWL